MRYICLRRGVRVFPRGLQYYVRCVTPLYCTYLLVQDDIRSKDYIHIYICIYTLPADSVVPFARRFLINIFNRGIFRFIIRSGVYITIFLEIAWLQLTTVQYTTRFIM